VGLDLVSLMQAGPNRAHRVLFVSLEGARRSRGCHGGGQLVALAGRRTQSRIMDRSKCLPLNMLLSAIETTISMAETLKQIACDGSVCWSFEPCACRAARTACGMKQCDVRSYLFNSSQDLRQSLVRCRTSCPPCTRRSIHHFLAQIALARMLLSSSRTEKQ